MTLRISSIIAIFLLVGFCSCKGVSYKTIHYGIYWNQSPYDIQNDKMIGAKNFIEKRNLEWGNSFDQVKRNISGYKDKDKGDVPKTDISLNGMLTKVNLFPEIRVAKFKKSKSDVKRDEKYEEGDIFTDGEFHFYNDKLYEVELTFSVYKEIFDSFKISENIQKDKNEDPTFGGSYHICELIKQALESKYGKCDEKIHWQINPAKQVYYKSDEELGLDLFQKSGQCFKEYIWKLDGTEIRLTLITWGLGVIKLYYWSPELRKEVSRLEVERMQETADKHF